MSGPRFLRARRCSLFTAVAAVSVALFGLAPPASSGAADEWPMFLHDLQHSSYSPETVISPSQAGLLEPAWDDPFKPDKKTFPDQPSAALYSSPTVADGKVFIGAKTGVFYGLDEATGHVLWKTFLGYQPASTCAGWGITATAAVAFDSQAGELRVYVPAGDGFLYALAAEDGAIRWHTRVVDPGTDKNEGMNWASPTILGNRIYVGRSSNCDKPLIRGGYSSFDLFTGAKLATHFTVPKGALGASVWSTMAAKPDGSELYSTVGNSPVHSHEKGQSYSILRVNPNTLHVIGKWTVPAVERVHDSDFGASPTVWTAMVGETETTLVGACNKNSKFYALNADHLKDGPVWSLQLGVPHTPNSPTGSCLGAAVFDRSHLYVGGPATTIRGEDFQGSIRQLDPATGGILWETGLPGAVQGSSSMDAAGVLAVPVYDYSPDAIPGVYLIDASNGDVVGVVDAGQPTFAQPVFAGPYLFAATVDRGLMAFTVDA